MWELLDDVLDASKKILAKLEEVHHVYACRPARRSDYYNNICAPAFPTLTHLATLYQRRFD